MRKLVWVAVALTGCANLPCDEQRIDLEVEHVSHPLIGPPFNNIPEDALSHAQALFKCTRGPVYVETGIGYKLEESGFVGHEITGSSAVGINLWRSK